MKRGVKNIISGIMALFALFIFSGNAFSGIEVTPEDLLQGYEDKTEAAIISVFTNNPYGYVLLVCGGIHESFSAVMISAGIRSFNVLPEDCMEIYSPSHGMLNERKQLNYRIYSSPESPDGIYLIPVSVTAYPL